MNPFTRLDAALEEFKASMDEVLQGQLVAADPNKLTVEELAFCIGTEEGFTYPVAHRLLAAVDVVHAARQRNKNVDNCIRRAGVVTKKSSNLKFPGEQ